MEYRNLIFNKYLVINNNYLQSNISLLKAIIICKANFATSDNYLQCNISLAKATIICKTLFLCQKLFLFIYLFFFGRRIFCSCYCWSRVRIPVRPIVVIGFSYTWHAFTDHWCPTLTIMSKKWFRLLCPTNWALLKVKPFCPMYCVRQTLSTIM